jgi:hypothetical protein
MNQAEIAEGAGMAGVHGENSFIKNFRFAEPARLMQRNGLCEQSVRITNGRLYSFRMIGFVPVFHFYSCFQQDTSRRSGSVTIEVTIVHATEMVEHIENRL